MTQTPNLDEMTTPELLDHIAAEATTYADAYFAQTPVGGYLGKKWDQQAAHHLRIAAVAKSAATELKKLQSGSAPHMHQA